MSIAFVGVCFAACTAPPSSAKSKGYFSYPSTTVDPDGDGDTIATTYEWNEGANQGSASPDYGASPDTGIADQGGPIMEGPVGIQMIYYGFFTPQRMDILNSFVANLDGSPLASVLTTYRDVLKSRATGRFFIAGPPVHLINHNAFGDSIDGDLDFLNLITGAVVAVGGQLRSDTIYVVVTDSTTSASYQGNDLCPALGWHGSLDNDNSLIFAFIGDPGKCGNAIPAPGPNGDAVGDHMVSALWHEIAEAITDPLATTDKGFFASHAEAADLCEGDLFKNASNASTVGYVQTDWGYPGAQPGSQANVHLGARDFAVQPLWQNLIGGGGCVRRIVANRPSVSPNPAHPVGDLDGDKSGDLLFRNIATTNVNRQLITAGPVVGALTTFGHVNNNWVLYGVADFDGDGASDLLWRDQDTGAISVWTNGGGHHLTESSSDDWVIRGVGYFDNNRFADIVFYNVQTSALHIWLNTNGSLAPFGSISQASWATDLQPGPTANIDTVGVGDFDGDGLSDILWKFVASDGFDSTSQPFVWWKMNGRHATSAPVNADKFIALGVADIHATGKASLIARLDANVVAIDVPTGAVKTIAAWPGNQWRYGGSTVYVSNVGTRGALYFQHRQNGQIDRWALDAATGTVASLQTLVPASPTPNLADELIAF